MEEFTRPHSHGTARCEAQLHGQVARIADFQVVADVFRLLDDPSRVRIFWLLCHGEECVINLSAYLEMISPAVSHHLRQLKESGLLVSRREGREVYYKAADTAESQLLHRAIEQLMAMTCPDRAKGGGESV